MVCRHPDGKLERVTFADLKAVIIETNDSGPWGTDVWWILLGERPEARCVFPGGATGEQDVLKAVQQLPGFDNAQFAKAMTCTDVATFICWRAPVVPGPEI